jgi:hypothetical protein
MSEPLAEATKTRPWQGARKSFEKEEADRKDIRNDTH